MNVFKRKTVKKPRPIIKLEHIERQWAREEGTTDPQCTIPSKMNLEVRKSACRENDRFERWIEWLLQWHLLEPTDQLNRKKKWNSKYAINLRMRILDVLWIWRIRSDRNRTQDFVVCSRVGRLLVQNIFPRLRIPFPSYFIAFALLVCTIRARIFQRFSLRVATSVFVDILRICVCRRRKTWTSRKPK